MESGPELRTAGLVLEITKTNQMAIGENLDRVRANPTGINIGFELIGCVEQT